MISLFRRPSDASQRGDTIVEVLIAMAIISLVLAAAYVTSSRNTALMQNSLERQEAQRQVQTQIEMLRAKGVLGTSNDCFNDSGAEVSGAANCDNRKISTNGDAAYNLHITCPSGTCTTTSIYTVTATWSSLGGNKANDSSVTMYYRMK